MNNNDEYIKMVLALDDEFFKGWKWKEGDKGLIISEEREVIMLGQTGQLIWYYDRGDLLFNPEYVKNDIATIEINYIRPLPNQKQLQKMLIDFENKDSKYRHSNYFTISERFIAVVIEGDLVADMELKTLNEMWLEFVVYLMYALVWNGESWEKMV